MKNASERAELAAAAANRQLLIRERTTTKTEQQVCLDQWRCVLCDDSSKGGLCIRESPPGPWTSQIGSTKRVRSDQVSYHFVFTKAACTDLFRNLLVEQDAAGELRCGSITNQTVWTRKWRLEFSVFTFLHQTSVIVIVREKVTKLLQKKKTARKNLGRLTRFPLQKKKGW